MSAPAQVLANRENSLHSTGPKTAAGKAVSSMNSMRHGLTSKSIVIPGEDPAEYDAYRAGLLKDYAPANEMENLLADEVIACSWRLIRARRHEAAILTRLLGDDTNPDAAYARLFIEKPKEMQRLLRYITSIERSFQSAFTKLEKLQKERRAAERKDAIQRAWVEGAIRASKPQNGFVSQSAPQPSTPRPAVSIAAIAGQPRAGL